MHDHRSAKTKETELHAPNIQQPRMRFIDDVQVIDLVFSRSELL
jgi:hypothetical protein